MDDRWFRLGDHGRYPALLPELHLFQVTNNIWIGEFATEDFRGVCRFFGITHILNDRITEST